MAYTYDDFVNAATQKGMLNQFGDDDLKLAQTHPEYGLSMLSLKSDYGNAKTDEQRLLINETANQLRNSYQPMQSAQGGTAVSSAAAAPTAVPGATPAAQPAAAAGTRTNVGGIQQLPQSFNWNMEADPSYQAYRKTYLREGDRATANALGQASAASAGRPSTYAVQAATQAGDYYAGQLGDKIPTLYENAYNRYMTEQQQAAANMESAYNNLAAQIGSYGYKPSEDELAQAGMSKELAQQMYQQWIMKNPDSAYMQGAIDANKYYQITGKYPNGYSTGGGGGALKSSFIDEYRTLVADQDVSSAAINDWLNRKAKDGTVDGATAKRLLITGADRASDKLAAQKNPDLMR